MTSSRQAQDVSKYAKQAFKARLGKSANKDLKSHQPNDDDCLPTPPKETIANKPIDDDESYAL